MPIQIIDGNYYVNRAVRSKAGMTLFSNGQPTGGLHSFLNTLWTVKENGTLVVAFDSDRSSYRKRLHPTYKERAVAPKDELLERVKQVTFGGLAWVLPKMGIPVVKVEGEEADDVIYLLAKHLVKDNSIYAVSDDEDFLQFLNIGVTINRIAHDHIVTKQSFQALYNFPPEAFVLYKSLIGDKSDMIERAIPGVGEVTAKKIVSQLSDYSLKGLYEWCEHFQDSKLKQDTFTYFPIIKRNYALISLENAQIKDEVVINAYEKACKEAIKQPNQVRDFLASYELKTQLRWYQWMTK